MGLYALNNPGIEIRCVEGIVEKSAVGTRKIHCEDYTETEMPCTRYRLSHLDGCFIFGSEVNLKKGTKVRFYEHDRGEAGIVIELAGFEVLSKGENIRECRRGYAFRD